MPYRCPATRNLILLFSLIFLTSTDDLFPFRPININTNAAQHSGHVRVRIKVINKSLSYGLIQFTMAQPAFAEHNNVWRQYTAIRENDQQVLRQLYVANYPQVESYVLNNNGTADQAKDIYQEAFLAVWRNVQLDRFNPQNGAGLEAYLFQIAKNKWMDYLRSGHYTKVIRMDAARLSTQEADRPAESETEYLAAVKKHFPALGDNCKKILTLYYYDNKSLKLIADEMGWTEATAKNNKYRCIQKLKELINR